MSYISIKCKNCGSEMSMNIDSKTITCVHCGSTFLLSQLLDEKDLAFIEKIKPDDLTKKINSNEALKDGDVCMFKGDYQKAEEFYKKAIEIDDKNYKGYLGLVRAKTHNYNILPSSEDYKEYAKLAYKYADGDDAIYVKNELEKLDLLKNEKEKIKKLKAEKFSNASKKPSKHSIITKITSVVVALLLVGILIGVIINQNKKPPKEPPKEPTIEISTVADFLNLYENEGLLTSTIVIKDNLNFEGASLESIGSSEKPFTGKFYGNGYSLSNFKLKNSNSEYENHIGLFKYAKNAIITGINLSGVTFVENKTNNFYANNIFGFICGYAENTQIKKCEVENTCRLYYQNQKNASFMVGGIVGHAKNSLISQSYVNANMKVIFSGVDSFANFNSLNFYMGGLVGLLEDSKIANSYSASTIDSTINSNITNKITSSTGGLVGKIKYTKSSNFYLNNSFFAGTISINVNTSHPSAIEPSIYLGGLAADGLSVDKTSLNLVLFETTSYHINGTTIVVEDFNDYTSNLNVVEYVYNSDSLILKISTIFDDKVWTLGSETPTLK